jgi:NADH:ubiquinone oxidoreductase subunit 5 (subunit L)/multisubunit Na+/H+ antiporter MnhA subunit
MNKTRRIIAMLALFAIAATLNFVYITRVGFGPFYLKFTTNGASPSQRQIAFAAGLLTPVLLLVFGVLIGLGSQQRKRRLGE